MIDDQQLTEHFSLYELTRTDNKLFADLNRDVNPMQITKLTQVARLLEHVRFVLGAPLIIHSGYRCKALNDSIGSTDSSQHLLCEAADFSPVNLDLGESFRKLWKDVKDNKTNVGQLIFETANRSYGVVSWIHISLGSPYRDSDKCAEILRMENGSYSRLA